MAIEREAFGPEWAFKYNRGAFYINLYSIVLFSDVGLIPHLFFAHDMWPHLSLRMRIGHSDQFKAFFHAIWAVHAKSDGSDFSRLFQREILRNLGHPHHHRPDRMVQIASDLENAKNSGEIGQK